MSPRRQQPGRLKRGKAFHLGLQADWERSAKGAITRELSANKPNGRRGRIDIHAESTAPLVAVVEIKATDWDRMTIGAVRRNVSRHARQVWDYVESQLASAKEVSPGLIYPSLPRSAARRDLIEALLEEHGISVVWDDESVRSRRARARE